MKKIILLLVGVIVSSCTNATIDFTTKKMEQKTTMSCDDVCTKVSIEIPEATNGSKVADSINLHVLNIAKEIIYFGDNPKAKVDYLLMMKSFISSFEQMQKKFPEEIIPWECRLKGEVTYQSEDLVAIKVNYYNYTGGAYGFTGVRSVLIDKVKGKSLQALDLFRDIDEFKKVAESRFRKQNNIPAIGTINATGFMFEKEQFTLPENIIFLDKGIVLFYNMYEVSSYTDGPKEIYFDYTEISKFLKLK